MNVLALVVGSVAAAIVADAFVSGRVERHVKARRRLRTRRPTQAVREAELRLPQLREELTLHQANLHTYIRCGHMSISEARARKTVKTMCKQIAAAEALVKGARR